MSHFYASIQGNRGEATRQGHRGSGITGHVRGWNTGIRVTGYVVISEDGQEHDEFQVVLTGGSNGRTSEKYIGTFTEAT